MLWKNGRIVAGEAMWCIKNRHQASATCLDNLIDCNGSVLFCYYVLFCWVFQFFALTLAHHTSCWDQVLRGCSDCTVFSAKTPVFRMEKPKIQSAALPFFCADQTEKYLPWADLLPVQAPGRSPHPGSASTLSSLQKQSPCNADLVSGR